MRGVLPWASIGLMIAAGIVLWNLAQLESVSPQAPTIRTASPLPTSTPDGQLATLVVMVETLQPTPTKTPRPPATTVPTWTPIPYCGGVTGECIQWTPTPTKTPRATPTDVPTLGPCRTPDTHGDYPRTCLGE
jgi:hypothetical protein